MDRLQILWVAQSYTMPKAGVKKHSHPYYHMFYIVKGTCLFEVENKPFELLPGQCILVPRQTEHAYTNEKDILLEYQEIKFTMPRNSMDSQLVKAGIQISCNPVTGHLFRQIVKEYSDLGNLADTVCASYLNALLNTLSEKERYQKQQQFRFVDASSFSELSQRIIHHLEAHYSEDISLDGLAESLGFNKSYLCVAFKKDTGFTILDCLNTIRIRRAAELIVYSDHSLTQVADLCGFASVSHFNRVFLKYAGITPGQCRRAYPMDILFESPRDEKSSPDTGHSIPRPDRFMYSVLAQKHITPKMIKELDMLEKSQGSCDQ